MTCPKNIKVLVLCTVEGGLDSLAEVIRQGHEVVGIVGVDPKIADPEIISGL